jgi:putative transferase (TIGR04331 family)
MATYIALTALESHWGKPGDTLLLTESCRLYDGGNAWERYPNPVDTERFPDFEAFDAAKTYCETLIDPALLLLAERPEIRYRLGFPPRFYERLLYNWLYHFIGALYDRYISVQRATALGGDICFLTARMDNAPHPTRDTLSYEILSSQSEEFNLYFYSDIITYLKLPQQASLARKLDTDLPLWDLGFRRSRKLQAFLRTAQACSGLAGKPVHLLNQVYGFLDGSGGGIHSPRELLSKGIFRLHPFHMLMRIPSVTPDTGFRAHPLALPRRQDETFEKLLGAFVPRYLPFAMCECLPDIVRWAKTQPLPSKGILASSMAVWTNPPLMVLAGVRSRPLAMIEHGGGQMMRTFISAKVQNAAADRYFAPGGTAGLPGPYFAGISARRYITAPLFVSTNAWRFTTRLAYYGLFRAYAYQRVNYQKAFLRLLPPHKFPEMRLYFRDYGRGIQTGLNREFPALRYQDANQIHITQAISDTCLIVMDHYGTTLSRCMATNRPVLLFSPADLLSVEGKNIFKRLESARIWHDTPESAAAFYDELIPDGVSSWADAASVVNEWWFDTATQDARERFCEAFARTSQEWAEEWLHAFDRLSKDGPRTTALCD